MARKICLLCLSGGAVCAFAKRELPPEPIIDFCSCASCAFIRVKHVRERVCVYAPRREHVGGGERERERGGALIIE